MPRPTHSPSRPLAALLLLLLTLGLAAALSGCGGDTVEQRLHRKIQRLKQEYDNAPTSQRKRELKAQIEAAQAELQAHREGRAVVADPQGRPDTKAQRPPATPTTAISPADP